MSRADVARLEAERLRPAPRDERPGTAELIREIVRILDAAIREDQAQGTWGRR